MKQQAASRAKGMKVDKDEAGKITSRPFTAEEIKSDPGLKELADMHSARMAKDVAAVRQGDFRNQLAQQRTAFQGQMVAIKKQLADHTISGDNKGIPKLGETEKTRMASANIAHDYIKEMQALANKRPDLFGRSGFLDNKLNEAFSKKDPDAMRWATLSELMALPAVSAHARNAAAVKEMRNMNNNLYQNAAAVHALLDEEEKGFARIAKNGGRPEAIQFPWMRDGAAPTAGAPAKAASQGGQASPAPTSGRISYEDYLKQKQ